MTDLIGEWLEEERLNAPDIVLPSSSLGPSIGNVAEIETLSAEASEWQPVVEVDPVGEPSSRVATIQPLINLEEEPIAIDVEEADATVNPTIV